MSQIMQPMVRTIETIMIGNDSHLRNLIKITLTFTVTGLLLSYVVFQARFLITGPQIVLNDDIATVQNQRTVTLSGQAFQISRLWLNDRPIFTDSRGNFEEALVLENGYTIATLKAEDRFGRVTKVHQPFVYTPITFIP